MYPLWYIFIGVTFLWTILLCGGNNRDWSVIPATILIITSVALLAFCIGNPISAKKEMLKFENVKEVVESCAENGSGLENISLTQKIIDANMWIANVKTSKQMYGCFSRYYNIDIDNIEPIRIPKK